MKWLLTRYLVKISKGTMKEKLIIFVILSAFCASLTIFFFFSLKLQEPNVKKLEEQLQGGQIEEVILQVKKS